MSEREADKHTAPVCIAVAVDDEGMVTVLDFARHIVVVRCRGADVLEKNRASIDSAFGPLRAAQLSELGAEMLLCGCVSTPLRLMLTYRGITVHSGIRGTADEAVEAFVVGRVEQVRSGRGKRRNRKYCRGCGRGRRGRGRGSERGDDSS